MMPPRARSRRRPPRSRGLRGRSRSSPIGAAALRRPTPTRAWRPREVPRQRLVPRQPRPRQLRWLYQRAGRGSQGSRQAGAARRARWPWRSACRRRPGTRRWSACRPGLSLHLPASPVYLPCISRISRAHAGRGRRPATCTCTYARQATCTCTWAHYGSVAFSMAVPCHGTMLLAMAVDSPW